MMQAKQLRLLLESPETNFLMEAHNAISAKIAESTGFKALWASGLSISTALGVRDSNELSWSQVIDVLEYIVDAVSIPILVDGDTGHGNFNNARNFAKKLCQLGVAGLCIEDKTFPKMNSFVGNKQLLADIDEFSGKIKAIKDHQPNSDFCVIARVEALIAGAGMSEALRRAEAYRAAGADAILIHSKQSTADEILEFTRCWDTNYPLIIVPTKYYKTPTEDFIKAGISLIIWANHNIRASIKAMEETCKQIFNERSLLRVEGEIAELNDIFSLIDYDELSMSEKKYLPKISKGKADVRKEKICTTSH